MKVSIAFSLLIFFLPCVFAGCVRAQERFDLSTDEAVIERLKTVQNKNFSKDKICIERVNELGEVIVIGSARYDYGCHLEGVFANSIYFESGTDLSKNALSVLGWKQQNRETREKTAKIWAEKVLLAFHTILYEPDKNLTGVEFTAPQTISAKNGEFVVTVWTSVMRRKKEFYWYEFRFAEDGDVTEKQIRK